MNTGRNQLIYYLTIGAPAILADQDVELILHKEEVPGLQNIRNRMNMLGETIHFHYKNNEQKTVMMIPVG